MGHANHCGSDGTTPHHTRRSAYAEPASSNCVRPDTVPAPSLGHGESDLDVVSPTTPVVLFAMLLGFAFAAGADDTGVVRREDALKAAYLFNFAKFVDWPGAADGTLTICFRGGRGVQLALSEDLANKRIGAHPLATRSLANGESGAACSVLYVAADAHRLHALPLACEQALPVLTVSDAIGFVHKGGMIELFREGNRLRFNVNVVNARCAGIRISSSLLQLASVVEKGGER